ncbi:hypothetical protein C882_4304 [Caenispirillum salinarum AK4]|uniref:UPF0235 protein C882_4304 n=1 Tax=Caenispirillum salinarum AK4 TaxID=1238182 RepID=K9GWG1_9PROT|nr:DUF167 family protein [Caenispirillum salinarum]EKV30345.1 hypothetical protein C882_4304 [Caenispirillum salinarum AK4]
MAAADPDIADAPPLEPCARGVRLFVRLTPKASRNALQGLAADADGGRVLKVAVTAVPENGKANQALVKLLAKVWKLPKSAVSITAGATDRRKTLLIESDDPQALADHLWERMRDHG